MTDSTINDYFEYMEHLNWKYSGITIDECENHIVSLNSCKANKSSVVATIMALSNTKITIVGKSQESNEHRASDFALGLYDNDGNEISYTTKILIRKVSPHSSESENIFQLRKIPYELISVNNTLDKKFYNFDISIELSGKRLPDYRTSKLEIIAINPDKDIDHEKTKLMLECYEFRE